MTLVLSAKKTLSVPMWMLQQEAAQIQIDLAVVIPHTVLLEVVDLLSTNGSPIKPRNNALEPLDGSTQS